MTREERTRNAREYLKSAPQRGEVFIHYKGGRYQVLCCSLMENNLEPLITYQSSLTGDIWTRTLTNWHSLTEDEDGDIVLRFRPAEAKDVESEIPPTEEHWSDP